MPSLTRELHRTAVAQWAEAALDGHSLATARPGDGTLPARLRYCAAVLAEIADRPAYTDFTAIRLRREDLQRWTGHAASSTLYATAGKAAASSVWQALPAELSAALTRGDIVSDVVIETKVLSYRPYRNGWLRALGDGVRPSRFAAETMIRVLADWAMRNPGPARLGRCAAPLSAVEDLTVVSAGKASPAAVLPLLAKVVRLATGPAGQSTLAVLSMVHQELMTVLGIHEVPYLDEAMGQAAEPLDEIEYLLPRLVPEQRRHVIDQLFPRLTRLLRLLEDLQEGEDRE